MKGLFPARSPRDEELERQRALLCRKVSFWRLPNLITIARTTLAVPILGWCALQPAGALLAIGWIVFWAGDLLDGFTARCLNLETRAGAVLDSLCDRISMIALLLAVGAITDWRCTWTFVFMMLFCVVDVAVSLSFLRLRLISPVYFWLVDVTVWTLNWHPVAKAASLAPFVLISFMKSELLAAIYCLVYMCVKFYALGRIALLVPARGHDFDESERSNEDRNDPNPVRPPLGRPLHPVEGWTPGEARTPAPLG